MKKLLFLGMTLVTSQILAQSQAINEQNPTGTVIGNQTLGQPPALIIINQPHPHQGGAVIENIPNADGSGNGLVNYEISPDKPSIIIGTGGSHLTLQGTHGAGKVNLNAEEVAVTAEKEVVLMAPKVVIARTNPDNDDDPVLEEVATVQQIERITRVPEFDNRISQTENRLTSLEHQVHHNDLKARSYAALAGAGTMAVIATPPNGGIGMAGYTIQGQSAIAIGGRVPLSTTSSFVFSASRSQYATGLGVGVGWSW